MDIENSESNAPFETAAASATGKSLPNWLLYGVVFFTLLATVALTVMVFQQRSDNDALSVQLRNTKRDLSAASSRISAAENTIETQAKELKQAGTAELSGYKSEQADYNKKQDASVKTNNAKIAALEVQMKGIADCMPELSTYINGQYVRTSTLTLVSGQSVLTSALLSNDVLISGPCKKVLVGLQQSVGG